MFHSIIATGAATVRASAVIAGEAWRLFTHGALHGTLTIASVLSR